MSADCVLRETGCGPVAAEVLAALPEWFGRPAATSAYIALADAHPTFVSERDGEPTGFLTLRPHFDLNAEIAVMGVLPALHRHGIGRRLVGAALDWARDRGVGFLSVKTLGPSRTDAAYAATRAFYDAMGFCPFEVLDGLWGADTPCLLMVRPVS